MGTEGGRSAKCIAVGGRWVEQILMLLMSWGCKYIGSGIDNQVEINYAC